MVEQVEEAAFDYYDRDGYMISFSLNEEEKIKKFFEKHGFVVVRDCLSPEECSVTVDECWEVQRDMSNGVVSRSDPSTWSERTWPGMTNEGISGGSCVFTPQMTANRQNAKVMRVFSYLYDTERLLVNHDRFGLFRPDRPTLGENGNEHYATIRNVHIDLNPCYYAKGEEATLADAKLAAGLTYKMDQHFIFENNLCGGAGGPLHVQGLINLCDNQLQDGGFHVVPGVHSQLVQLAAERGRRWDHFGTRGHKFCTLPEGDPLQLRALRVTCRVGSVVAWDQRSPHGSSPNQSTRARCAQFVKFVPADRLTPKQFRRRGEAVRLRLERHSLTPLDTRVLGMSEYAPVMSLRWLRETHVKQLVQLQQECAWWAHPPRTWQELRTALHASSAIVALVDRQQQLLAFARAVGDTSLCTWIYDVMVRKEYRRRGLARRVMEELLARPECAAARCLMLNCKREMVPFYASFGFTERASDIGPDLFVMHRSKEEDAL